MRIKNKEAVILKKRLKLVGIKGLALDIDDTLSSTLEGLIQKLMDELGNPENLTPKEMAKKYTHTDLVPYWQTEETGELIRKIVDSEEVLENLPLIQNAEKSVKKINKSVPIVTYLTARPEKTRRVTQDWLKKHGFPEAKLIMRPDNIEVMSGNKWKAEILEYLYPQVLGIIDDNINLQDFLSKDYKGTVYLYENNNVKRNDIKVIHCRDWENAEQMIKEVYDK